MPIIRGDDRQRLVPKALVSVLSALLADLELPDYRAVELRDLQRRICRLYDMPAPTDPASDVEVAQALAEEDGIPQDY